MNQAPDVEASGAFLLILSAVYWYSHLAACAGHISASR